MTEKNIIPIIDHYYFTKKIHHKNLKEKEKKYIIVL